MANKANRIALQQKRKLLLAAGWTLADIEAHRPYLFPAEEFRRDKDELELRVEQMRKHVTTVYNPGRPRYRQATAKYKTLRQVARYLISERAVA